MRFPSFLPVAIACLITALIPSAPAEEDIATLKAEAEEGSPEAQTKLGDTYQTGKGTSQDSAAALNWYLKAAAQGHSIAQFRLGNMYAYGAGVPRNFPEAMKWHLKAAEQGHAGAQLYVGVEHLEGDEANRDFAAAMKWLRKAADQDLPIAQFYVGILHVHGAGVPKDARKGIPWLIKAAKQGEPHAQYHLGNMHRQGEGVPKDTVTGLKYLNLAAMNAGRVPEGETAWSDLRKLEQEIAPEVFARGREEAVKWAREEAGRGLPEAQYVLGMMHSIGHGMAKDLVQAHLYLSLGLASDHVPEAHYDRIDLEKKMTPAEIEESRRLAKEWKAAAPESPPPSWDLPAGMKTLPVNGYPMAYLERGSGPTLVLVHGALNDCRYWEPQLGSLSRDRRVVAVSLRHHFPEPWDGKDGRYSIEAHAEDLARFIEALGGGPVDLGGHSRGGAVAALVARARPDLVRKLVLAEPAILSLLPAAGGAEARAEGVKQLNQKFARGEIEPALEFYVDRVNGPGTWKGRSEEVLQFARDNAWTISRQATDTETIGKEGIAALKMPVLLIGGEKSPPMFGAILDTARGALPTSVRETVPGAGHPLNRENPEAFNRVLSSFLAK